MYRTNTEPADASPTVPFNTLEYQNESIARNNNFSRSPCCIWRPRTLVSRRRIHQQSICPGQQINAPNTFTSAINCGARTTAAIWSWRIIRDQLPLLSRRTYGGCRSATTRTSIAGSRSFRLDGTHDWNPSMALARTRRANIRANQSLGAGTSGANHSDKNQRAAFHCAQFNFCQFQFAQFHIVWQRWSIALEAWSLVCPTLHFKHTRKDFATCQ